MVTAHAAPGQRRVDDPTGAGPERHVRNSATFRKEQQIARFVAGAVWRHCDLCALAELLIAVARQCDTARAVHRLDQARAVDAPLGPTTPEIRRAAVPLLRELRQREMPRF